MRADTCAILTEAPESQSFEMEDIPAIAEAARRRGVCVVMNNTWATPLFFPPHERGVDIAIGPAPNVSRAIPTCCSASSPPMRNGGRGCTPISTIAPSPPAPSRPGHEIWKRNFLGSSGLFGIVLHPAPEEAVAAMLDGLELFGMGYSWGGYESLVIPSYRPAAPWAPGGPTLRLQIGLEDIEIWGPISRRGSSGSSPTRRLRSPADGRRFIPPCR